MAVKTFTTGEVLTASDTNTYLNNGGLVYITETSFTAQTAVIVDNCFTSTFANYRLELDLSAMSADDVYLFQWRTGGSSGSTYGTADYDYQLQETFSTSVTAVAGLGSTWHRISYGYATPGYLAASIDIFNPQAAKRVQFISQAMTVNGTSFVLVDQVLGVNRVTTSFTGIRIGNLIGNRQMTGTLRIYGYRNS